MLALRDGIKPKEGSLPVSGSGLKPDELQTSVFARRPSECAARARCEYPMYVMQLSTLLSLEAMVPHQELLRRGLLQEWTTDMDGRTLFISHAGALPGVPREWREGQLAGFVLFHFACCDL